MNKPTIYPFTCLFRIFFALALQVWMSSFVQGQTSTLDSLSNVLKISKQDTSKVNVLLELSHVSREDLIFCSQKAREALTLSLTLNNNIQIARSFRAVGISDYRVKKYDSAMFYMVKADSVFTILKDYKSIGEMFFLKGLIMELLYDLDSTAYYYSQAIAMASKANDQICLAEYTYYAGNLEDTRGNNADALRYLNQSFELYKSIGDGKNAWMSLNSAGVVYDKMGMYPEALAKYLEAAEMVKKSNFLDAKIILFNNLGLVYQEMGKLEYAEDNYNKGFKLALDNKMVQEESFLLNNISILQIEKGDTSAALISIQRSHAINLGLEDHCDLAYSCEGLGEMLMWKGKKDSSLLLFNDALKWAIECNNKGSQASIYKNLGLLYAKMGNRKRAERYLLQSMEMSKISEFVLQEKEAAFELFKFYNKNNNIRKALQYHLTYTSLKDEMINEETVAKIERMSSEYEFKQKMETIQFEKQAQEIQTKEDKKRQKTYQTSILIVLILTVLLAATLGRSFFLMQRHNSKLKGLNEEKNTLIGVVAHDLRSPLNNIKGLMSLVKMEASNLSPEQMHYFNLVDDTMERMRDMIDRVLDVSAIEDMKVHLNLKNVDLGFALNFVAGNYETLAEKKSIKIHCNVPTENHFSIVDYNYLIQVFDNLLSNAIKFSETNKNIFIDIFNEDEYEIVVFRDEGPGISEDDMKKLFSKFQKLSAQPTDNEQSTGLGLSIVKKFVDAMNAQIGCESEVGKGTSFIIKFKTAELSEPQAEIGEDA